MRITYFFIILLSISLTATAQNHPPVAVNDTVSGYSNQKVYVNLLQNDFDPDGDSIFVINSFSIKKINDTLWEIRINPQYLFSGDSTSFTYIPYKIRDEHDSIAKANVVCKDLSPLRYDYADVNNINALISPVGQHFWDYKDARFEVPKGSGINSIFNNSLWIGGLNDSGYLFLAAEKYRQVGEDYFPGPISSLYDSLYSLKWNRVWKLNKTDIQLHINNWNQPAYQPADAIINWPSHGDTTLGQSANIAPFYDSNTNGLYEPMAGDYPLIRGDQSIFFIFNDSKSFHAESKGDPLGIEIHGMAYGYAAPDDSTLNNTLFMHYDIINKSEVNYHDTYMGLFTDFDLGYHWDDYMASDVTNGMLYAYNGYETDSTGPPWAYYGQHPPAVGLKIIGGPFLEPDGTDNPSGGCDYSINGLNFGDQVIDNERYGLTNSIVFIDHEPCYYLESFLAVEIYMFMQNKFKDNTHLIYGGNGHIVYGGVGPDCNYMFPGDSDTTCNWGTNGVMPNGGFNQNGYYWNEVTAGNVPADRRGLASIGPFTFAPGQSIPLDYCFTWARDYQGDNLSSVELLRERVSGLKPALPGLIGLPVTYFGIHENDEPFSLIIYPNPVSDKATVIIEGHSQPHYQLFSVNGTLLSQGSFKPGNNLLDVSASKPGVYILRIGSRNARIVKM